MGVLGRIGVFSFFDQLKEGINGISLGFQRGINGVFQGVSPEEEPGLCIGGINHLQ